MRTKGNLLDLLQCVVAISVITVGTLLIVPASRNVNASAEMTDTPDRYRTEGHSTSSLEGTFIVIWVDPIDKIGASVLSQRRYFIVDSQRMLTELDFIVTHMSEAELLQLNGYRVAVKGKGNQRGEKSGPFIVHTLEVVGREVQRSVTAETISTLVILCKFPDKQEYLRPRSHFLNMLSADYPGLDHYWQELSFGRINLTEHDVTDWMTLPHAHNYYVSSEGYANLNDLENDCKTLAGNDYDPSDYKIVNMVFNDSLGAAGYGGGNAGQGGTGVTFLGVQGYLHSSVFAHEIGHALGLPHSRGPNGTYTSVWDVMSNSYSNCDSLFYDEVGCIGQHTIAFYKHRLGWIPEDRTVEILPGDSKVVSIVSSTRATSGSGYQLARIFTEAGEGAFFTVEAREALGYDEKLPGSPIIIHYLPSEDGEASLIDDDDNYDSADEGAMWRKGEAYTNDTYGVTVTVIDEIADGFQVRLTSNPSSGVEFSCDTEIPVPRSECAALIKLYENLDGNNWLKKEGWLAGPDICHWFGVICASGHVSELVLSRNNLTGEIPTQIGDLPHVRMLWLGDNNLIGPIPANIGKLTALVGLYLDRNKLSGPIPLEIGNLKQLRWLTFYHNHLDGFIPKEIGSLARLEELVLDRNELAGPIPPELANLTSLGSLSLSDNPSLIGPLPLELIGLENLDALYYDRTGICQPEQQSFIQWLNTIQFLTTNELECGELELGVAINVERTGVGSSLLVYGVGFEEENVISINNREAGNVPGEGEYGELHLILKTTYETDPGYYKLDFSAHPDVSIDFFLDERMSIAPPYSAEGFTIIVPAGIGNYIYYLAMSTAP